jgi:DNA-binding beta-propeller fold protein YncE
MLSPSPPPHRRGYFPGCNDLESREMLRGAVTRVDLSVPRSGDGIEVKSMVQIASGYAFAPNASALVVGPTGLVYNPLNGTLYVASTTDNDVFAIKNAAKTSSDQGTGSLVYEDPAYLRGLVGLALGPNEDLFTTNGDAINGDPTQPSELIEFTPRGRFIGQLSLDPAQGAAFGLAFYSTSMDLVAATVNDDTNTLDERFVPH